MEQYIKKSALVTEIKRRIGEINQFGIKLSYEGGLIDAYKIILSSLDTLEVKEVDLEKETKKWWKEHLHLNPENKLWMDAHQSIVFAKHFFELGLKASNPITAADRGTAEEIIISLKRVEEDYRIDLTREIEWLRNKVKKGD